MTLYEPTRVSAVFTLNVPNLTLVQQPAVSMELHIYTYIFDKDK